ncbi:hypothetical protein NHX12_006436 [Muraenolepis orangiensis]|uniref:WD repeat, SAM and U-box domain-containing protein 1 n=1 Tax=Muraenolepis orangiensis TaxID=630683 RepID=A0A9Q0DT94_9TELE|nr:hypothetical protein NHX12_006436 [Muraenolepis orangiensis]
MVSLICTLQGHWDDVNWCAWSATHLATCSGDKTLRVYSSTSSSSRGSFTEEPYSPLTGHGYGVHCCCFSPCGQFLASCSTDATTVVWSVSSGEVEAELAHPGRSAVRVCAFSPDAKHLVSGAADGTLALWDVPDRRLISTQAVNEATVVACSFSPCGQVLASGSTYGDLRLWDLDMNQVHVEKNAHDLGVSCCCFSPHRDRDDPVMHLASCGQDSLVKIWTVFWTSAGGRTAAGRSRLLVSDWSEEDVGAWLTEEGLEGLVDTFRANNIDGAELLGVTKETLVELHVGEKLEELKGVSACSGVPDEYLCPITRELMKEPVMASDGFSYEREAIENWIARNRSSPMTNLPLRTTLLTPNHTLKMALGRWTANR